MQVKRGEDRSGSVSARSSSFALSSSLSLSQAAYDLDRAQTVCLKTPEQLLKKLFVSDLFGHNSFRRTDEPDEHDQHVFAQHYLQQDGNNLFYTEEDGLICRLQVRALTIALLRFP
jgi:hypothetical protein